MTKDSIPLFGIFLLGLLPALLLTYALFNPEGTSYFQSVVAPVWKALRLGTPKPYASVNSVSAFIGVCLLIGIVFYAKQVANFVGVLGLVLSIAFFSTFYWMLIEQKLLPSERISAHVQLILISLFLATSVTWPRRKGAAPAQPQTPTSSPEGMLPPT